jgi:anthranilate synthase/aminodeoxychorismate synthase-like glutamine amidotransferase
MKKLLLIDNYDSFTYNLVQYFQQLGCEVIVKRNDEISPAVAVQLNPDYLVFSPGPGTPLKSADIGFGAELFAKFRGKIPILGVCLGHQMIGHLLGGKIEKLLPVHGKRWAMKTLENSHGIFKDFPVTFEGMRYHSLVISRENFPDSIKITAETNDKDKIIMAFENQAEKFYGVQFHPESIGTKTGMQMLKNFLAV